MKTIVVFHSPQDTLNIEKKPCVYVNPGMVYFIPDKNVYPIDEINSLKKQLLELEELLYRYQRGKLHAIKNLRKIIKS